MTTKSSPLGFGLIATYCAAVLPYPQPGTKAPTYVTVLDVQPSLGLATNPVTNAAIPSTASGRTLLIADVIRRISTTRGSLPDVNVPTQLGRYGIDLLDSVNADMTPDDIGHFAAAVDGQIKQDERVVNSRTSCVLSGYVMLVTIDLVDGAGPFKLILAINTLTQNVQVLSQ